MSILDRLETKIGHWAIPGLLRYVASFNGLCFVLWKMTATREKPLGFLEWLTLDRDAILHGEVWRLLSYIFIPQVGGLFPDWFTMAFYILYLIWVGDGLEQAWGAFRLNAYYLLGILGTTLAAFIANADPAGFMLNTTLLLAFARFYPDTTILFMFVLPVKVKWLAWITGAGILWGFFIGGWDNRIATIVALGNFLTFFARDMIAEARTRSQVRQRRARFDQELRTAEGDALHRCHVCAKTEHDDPHLEFRVAADGEEYCADHLPPRV